MLFCGFWRPNPRESENGKFPNPRSGFVTHHKTYLRPRLAPPLSLKCVSPSRNVLALGKSGKRKEKVKPEKPGTANLGRMVKPGPPVPQVKHLWSNSPGGEGGLYRRRRNRRESHPCEVNCTLPGAAPSAGR